MLFVADPKKATKHDIFLIHVLPTFIVFVAFFAVTIWSWQTTIIRVNNQRDQAVSQEVNSVESRIKDRMGDYQQILISANGLFQASNDVDRNEWRTFYQNFDIPHHFPGLQGISYAERVPANQLAAHEAKIQAEGFSDYHVTPAGQREFYVPIIYPIAALTPENYKSLTGFGFDIGSDPIRAQALHRATDTRSSTLSGKLSLIQGVAHQPAFILYQPIYQAKDDTSPVGFAYAPFTAKNFFEGVFGQNANKANVGFKVYDDHVAEDRVLYKSALFDKTEATIIQRPLEITGHTWVIEYKAPASIISAANRRNPTATLIAGTIFSALIAGLVLSLLIGRTRSLAFAENRELQRAKDDLLSIASHQLRTPATGVKQYIGMLREGYGGKVSTRQKKLLDEAYNSNERQLGIIDEILHVARIDTGRLILQRDRIKIRAIVDQILREQAKAIKDKSQQILTKFPTKILYAYGDPQYVRMAIENIISNAVKYTHEGGTITISIKRKGDFAAISVTDTGVGIDKKDLHLLFQKFSRIPNQLSRQTAGSGVGLYIAKQLIDMHGGSIEVESTAGEGTTFSILLPLATRTPKGKQL